MPDGDRLLGFYDLLARIQAERFMRPHGGSAADLSDVELHELEWLHEEVRNQFEHYVPGGYIVPVAALLKGSLISVRLSNWLLYSSGAAFLYDPPRDLRTRLLALEAKAARLLRRFEV